MRKELSEEEWRIIVEFRHKNAVRNAFNEGLDSARAVLKAYSERNVGSNTQFILSELDHLIQEQHK